MNRSGSSFILHPSSFESVSDAHHHKARQRNAGGGHQGQGGARPGARDGRGPEAAADLDHAAHVADLPILLRASALRVVVTGQAALLHQPRPGVPEPALAFVLIDLVILPEALFGPAVVRFKPFKRPALEVVARAAVL